MQLNLLQKVKSWDSIQLIQLSKDIQNLIIMDCSNIITLVM